MRKWVFLFLIGCAVSVSAQHKDEDFDSFRRNLLHDYHSFRKGILDDYVNYLKGIWDEFREFKGEQRDEKPKPTVIPNVKNLPVDNNPRVIPTPEVNPASAKPSTHPTLITKPVSPTIPARPIGIPTVQYNFHGFTLKARKIQTFSLPSREPQTIAQTWQEYQQANPKEIVDELLSTCQQMGLNDWFTFELSRAYVDALLSQGNTDDRILLQHVLLSHMGYDIRLGKTATQLILLVNFKQKVYAHTYVKFGDIKYYVFKDNILPVSENNVTFFSCQIPNDVEKGRSVDLIYDNLIMRAGNGYMKECQLTDGKLSIKGRVDVGMIEMFRHYPQMDVPHYASSKLLPPFHQDIINQLKPQISGLSQQQAVNLLLHFVQYAFDYATDDKQHGYEKPYFLEENFYYPKNDCEDRSIFFAFLVHYLLNLDVHLIHFPGHECTAICFTQPGISGTHYEYKGKNYYICDPTYIGAVIGECMDRYINEKPVIELWLNN